MAENGFEDGKQLEEYLADLEKLPVEAAAKSDGDSAGGGVKEKADVTGDAVVSTQQTEQQDVAASSGDGQVKAESKQQEAVTVDDYILMRANAIRDMYVKLGDEKAREFIANAYKNLQLLLDGDAVLLQREQYDELMRSQVKAEETKSQGVGQVKCEDAPVKVKASKSRGLNAKLFGLCVALALVASLGAVLLLGMLL